MLINGKKPTELQQVEHIRSLLILKVLEGKAGDRLDGITQQRREERTDGGILDDSYEQSD